MINKYNDRILHRLYIEIVETTKCGVEL